MRFENPVPLSTIAQLIGAEVKGNSNGMVTGINELHKVEKGDLAFVDHPKYYATCINSAATFIIINKDTDTWGSFKYDVKKDLARLDINIERTTEIVENFSMYFEKKTGGANLVVQWDNVKANVPFGF